MSLGWVREWWATGLTVDYMYDEQEEFIDGSHD